MAVNMEVENTTEGVNARILTANSSEYDHGDQENSDSIEDSNLPACFTNELTAESTLSEQGEYTQSKNSEFSVGHSLATNSDEENSQALKCLTIQSSTETEAALEKGNKTELMEHTESSHQNYASQPPLAFTIDLGNNKEIDTAKYQNLYERYNARHKRNLSMSKVESNTKKAGMLLSPSTVQNQKIPSTHSEGYFSSEDDTKRKTDHFPEKFRHIGSKCSSKNQAASKKPEETSDIKLSTYEKKQDIMSRSYDDQKKHIKFPRKNLSLELGCSNKSNSKSSWITQKSATINDLSRIQTTNYDDDNEKSYIKNIEHIESNQKPKNKNIKQIVKALNDKVCNTDSMSSENNFTNTSAKASNLSSISYTMELNTDEVTNANLDVFNISNTEAGSDEAVSEAGTYTIHKDYTDEEKTRMDIDKIFSVGVLTDDENNESYVHSFKMSTSRDNNTWISEWATQVAQHNSLPPAIGGTSGRTPPLSPSKIPSPIHSKSQRMSRNRYEQSDSSLDAESFKRIKERIGLLPNQHTLIDSGGESDDDTSNSYNTPPHSSQRTPVHNAIARRSSLSESLFRRSNTNEIRISIRKCVIPGKSKTEDGRVDMLQSPSQDLTSYRLTRRSSSLDRKEYASDTTESNTSRRNSVKHYAADGTKHTNSPVMNRLRPTTPKLTSSPIVACKSTSTKMINLPVLEKAKHLTKSSTQAKNVGYFTCVENSPYVLRKSSSTTNYNEQTISHISKELNTRTNSAPQNSSEFKRNLSIQRSSSNASISIRNVLSRRSSSNNSDIDRASLRGRFHVASDSSSETGDQQTKPVVFPISSGIKLNRAFSIRRARLTCESDTTPDTTPKERRRRAQNEIKPNLSQNKSQSYHRTRTSGTSIHKKESAKKTDTLKPRAPFVSRTDSGRFSTRASKTSYHSQQGPRLNQKPPKDHKKSGRSNSTLTSKEVEFQNWKRRKSYDPMKAAAEGRKKLIDGPRKHHSIEDSTNNPDNSVLRSASFHGTGGTLSLASQWSDNELDLSDNKELPPPNSYLQQESDSDLETSSYLQATENVVSAMSARVTVYRPPLIDSDNDSDEDTSHSMRQNISKIIHQPSDTESSDEQECIAQPSNTKNSRAFNLRRGRIEPQATKTTTASIVKSKTSHDMSNKSESITSIARTDSGRFSMRLNRATNPGIKSKPKDSKKPTPPNAREVEMQNWKRRTSYDPMKAAMEGRRKAGLAKRNVNASLSPSSVARSQSFHGSAGFGASDWSDEELIISTNDTHLY